MEKSYIELIKLAQRFVGDSQECISHMTPMMAVLVGCEFTQPSNLPNESQVTLSQKMNYGRMKVSKYEKRIQLKIMARTLKLEL